MLGFEFSVPTPSFDSLFVPRNYVDLFVTFQDGMHFVECVAGNIQGFVLGTSMGRSSKAGCIAPSASVSYRILLVTRPATMARYW